VNPQSAKALVVAAVAGLLLGTVVMSPAAGFLLYTLAALAAAVPAIFARKGPRLAGAGVLAASLALAAMAYPALDAEMTRYRARAHPKASEGSAPPPSPPQERK
jgi:membrane protein implicated in regulation of membrane protease activity